MYRNPISDKRLSVIQKLLTKKYLDQYKQLYHISTKPFGKVLATEKIGPFKISLFVEEDNLGEIYEVRGPFRLTGFQHRDKERIDEILEDGRAQIQQKLQLIADEVEYISDQISVADPTPAGGYVKWIAIQVLEGHLNFPEDIEKVKEDLTSFHDLKRRKIIPKPNRDINAYKTYGNFFETLKAFGGVLSDKQRLQQAIQSGETVYKSEIYHVILVREWELAKHLATGTAWCVRGTNMAQYYLQDPENYPLYFFFKHGNQHALLTNLPNTLQFMDIHDSPITKKELETDDELRQIAGEISPWVACDECEAIYPNTSDEKRIVDDIYHSLLQQHFQYLPAAAVRIGPSAYLIFQAPPPILKYPIIASDEALEDMILIGPARQVIENIPYIRYPAIEPFFARSEQKQDTYTIVSKLIRKILEPNICKCGKINADDRQKIKAELLHALYVIQPCEDFGVLPGGYIVCGHELSPKYQGPCCPPRLMDWGPFVGIRCECGAFVTKGSRFSICPACLKSDEFSEEEDYPEEGDAPDPYDECPTSAVYDALRRMLPRWRKAATVFWNFSYDPKLPSGYARNRNLKWQGEKFEIPTWDDFDWLNDLLYLSNEDTFYGIYYSDRTLKLLLKYEDLFQAIKQQGFFDKEAFTYLLDAFEAIFKHMSSEIDAGHLYCCKDL